MTYGPNYPLGQKQGLTFDGSFENEDAPRPNEQTYTVTHINLLTGLIGELHHALYRTRSINNNFFGTAPEEVHAIREKTPSKEPCVLEQIQHTQDDLRLLITQLHDELTKLEKF